MEAVKQEISEGYCQCGCGEKTQISKYTCHSRGWVKGEPRKFIQYHHSLKSIVRYEIDPITGCWNWLGCKNKNGYGAIHPKGIRRPVPAHRVFYEEHKGLIPDGLILDHLCRNRGCVNPDHLEPVTYAENAHRGCWVKLSMEKARLIRNLYRAGNYTQKELARHFDVSQSSIFGVIHHKSWKEQEG